MTTRRRRLALAGLALASFAALAGLGVLAGAPAAASQGSVPAEVAAYAADPGGLLARLDDTAEVGQLNRVFVFTPAFLAGEQTETPVELANRWTAPIRLGGEPLGLAIVWINQVTIAPELADFTVDTALGAALAEVPADAALVHDEPRAAWFALAGEELAPLVPGASGLEGPIRLADYAERLADAAVPPPPAASAALALALVVVGLAVLAIVAVLLAPMARERMRRPPVA